MTEPVERSLPEYLLWVGLGLHAVLMLYIIVARPF